MEVLGEKKIMKYEKIFIGAGCINTTAIVDRSLYKSGSREYSIKLVPHLVQGLIKLSFSKSNNKHLFNAKDNYGFPTYYLGQLKDSYSLKALYSASDILLVPSRVESFCNTACEAQTCGTPVVSFKVGGLIDIVKHKKSGYLASPFDIKDFANGIIWVSDQINLDKKLNNLARKRAIENWDYSVVAKKYESLYKEIIQEAVPLFQ